MLRLILKTLTSKLQSLRGSSSLVCWVSKLRANNASCILIAWPFGWLYWAGVLKSHFHLTQLEWRDLRAHSLRAELSSDTRNLGARAVYRCTSGDWRITWIMLQGYSTNDLRYKGACFKVNKAAKAGINYLHALGAYAWPRKRLRFGKVLEAMLTIKPYKSSYSE